MRDYWNIDIEDGLSAESFVRRRRVVDALQIDWLDAATLYASPEVILLSQEEVQELSGWTEEEVRLLFIDRRFPATEYARKKVVEIHAFIQFFAKRDIVLAEQRLCRKRAEERFAQLRRERTGR